LAFAERQGIPNLGSDGAVAHQIVTIYSAKGNKWLQSVTSAKCTKYRHKFAGIRAFFAFIILNKNINYVFAV
jgi:hypothetical protein